MPVRRTLAIAAIAALAAAVAAGCTAPPAAPPPTTAPPSPMNRPPTITSVTPTAVTGLAPLTVTITATATDPDGDPIAFGWNAAGGRVLSATANSATVVLDEPGTYRASVFAADGCPDNVYDAMSCRSEAPPVAVTATVTGWDLDVLAAREAAIAADIVAFHNEERVARGLPALTVDAGLADADARDWAAGYLASSDVGHDDAWLDADRSRRGENLHSHAPWGARTVTFDGGTELTSASSGFDVHMSWMNSDKPNGHRWTVLDPRWERIGVVVICDPGSGQLAAITRFEGGQSGHGPVPDYDELATPPAPGEGVTCTRG